MTVASVDEQRREGRRTTLECILGRRFTACRRAACTAVFYQSPTHWTTRRNIRYPTGNAHLLRRCRWKLAKRRESLPVA